MNITWVLCSKACQVPSSICNQHEHISTTNAMHLKSMDSLLNWGVIKLKVDSILSASWLRRGSSTSKNSNQIYLTTHASNVLLRINQQWPNQCALTGTVAGLCLITKVGFNVTRWDKQQIYLYFSQDVPRVNICLDFSL